MTSRLLMMLQVFVSPPQKLGAVPHGTRMIAPITSGTFEGPRLRGKVLGGGVLNRWGHAYVNPQPGFFFGLNGKPAPRDVLRNQPHGRIAFANTDLAGASDHRNSIREADRAVKQLVAI